MNDKKPWTLESFCGASMKNLPTQVELEPKRGCGSFLCSCCGVYGHRIEICPVIDSTPTEKIDYFWTCYNPHFNDFCPDWCNHEPTPTYSREHNGYVMLCFYCRCTSNNEPCVFRRDFMVQFWETTKAQVLSRSPCANRELASPLCVEFQPNSPLDSSLEAFSEDESYKNSNLDYNVLENALFKLQSDLEFEHMLFDLNLLECKVCIGDVKEVLNLPFCVELIFPLQNFENDEKCIRELELELRKLEHNLVTNESISCLTPQEPQNIVMEEICFEDKEMEDEPICFLYSYDYFDEVDSLIVRDLVKRVTYWFLEGTLGEMEPIEVKQQNMEDEWFKVEFDIEESTCVLECKYLTNLSIFLFYMRFLSLEEISFLWFRDGYSDSCKYVNMFTLDVIFFYKKNNKK